MVLLIRLVHGALTAFFTSCIVYVYYAAVTRRRGRLLYGAIGALTLEGAVVMANGGDCPLGGLHHRYGDDKDFFELLMPRRFSRHAVPVLGAITIAGIALALVRSRAASSPRST